MRLRFLNSTFEPADTTAVDQAVAILRSSVDTTDKAKLGNVVLGGTVKTQYLMVRDGADFIEAPSADVDAFAAALNGRVDPIFGYLIF